MREFRKILIALTLISSCYLPVSQAATWSTSSSRIFSLENTIGMPSATIKVSLCYEEDGHRRKPLQLNSSVLVTSDGWQFIVLPGNALTCRAGKQVTIQSTTPGGFASGTIEIVYPNR